MPFSPFDPPYDQLMATAETVATDRPEVERDVVREASLGRSGRGSTVLI